MSAFHCNPEEFKCSQACCKQTDRPPFLTIADIQNLSAFLSVPPAEIWTRYLTLHGIPNKEKMYLHLGLNFSPFCPFIGEGFCRVYPARPEGCRIYPTIAEFYNPEYACLKTSLSQSVVEQQARRKPFHMKELEQTMRLILPGHEYLPTLPDEAEILILFRRNLKQIIKSSPDERKQTYLFLSHYLDTRYQLRDALRKQIDRFLISEYLFQLFYTEVKEALIRWPHFIPADFK